MDFSIIIPYKDNSVSFLKNCIESLEKQTYQNFEVIFIHQNSQQLEEQLSNSTLNYKNIKTSSSLKLPEVRNIGINEARGNYILFMDSDDYLHPNALIYMAQLVTEIPENNVFKLGISKTHLDKRSTLNKRKQSFYQDNILTSVENVLADMGVDANKERQIEFINSLFQRNAIPHHYTVVQSSQVFKKINYHLKVHGLLIKRSFINNNDLFFYSNNHLYSEIPFLARLYNNIDTIVLTRSKLYFKTIHNDPINYPSLSQEEYEYRDLMKCEALNEALEFCNDYNLAKRFKLVAIKHYIYTIAKSDRFNESFKNILPIYNVMHSLLNKPSNEIKLSKRQTPEIKAIKKGRYKLAYQLSKYRVLAFKTYYFSKKKNQRFRQRKVQNHIFSKLPIKNNTVLYESFLGKNYSDSPKAIFKHLLSSDEQLQHVWVLNDKDIVKNQSEFTEKNVKIIPRFSWQYFYYVTVSKYFVLNMRQIPWLYKKSEQIILSTWHGTPLKRLVFDMENVTSANKKYKKIFYDQSRNWDYLIAANEYSQNIFESAFMFPKEKILTYGYPRNDILANYTASYRENLKKELDLPLGKKVILYAPTWRDDEYHSVGKYKFKLQLDLDKLRRELGEDYVIILRMHYFISDNLDLSNYEGFAFDYSKYNDINDLYIVSDMLITDYSSVFFDFANLKKPILFFTYDIEKYQSMLRGFYINVQDDLPGPLLYTSDEVIDAIKNSEVVQNKYKEKYESFYHKYCILDDGNATERVVDTVFKK